MKSNQAKELEQNRFRVTIKPRAILHHCKRNPNHRVHPLDSPNCALTVTRHLFDSDDRSRGPRARARERDGRVAFSCCLVQRSLTKLVGEKRAQFGAGLGVLGFGALPTLYELFLVFKTPFRSQQGGKVTLNCMRGLFPMLDGASCSRGHQQLQIQPVGLWCLFCVKVGLDYL